MAVPVVSPAGIEGLRESAELLTRELKSSQAVKEVLFNLKGWEGGRARLVEDLLASGHRLARGAGVRGIVEEPGTLEGSACAVINVLKQCALASGTQGASLGLLIAGEGSRLWGVSAHLGFVKGLTNVLGTTLVQQTLNQLALVLAQAPNRGNDMVFIAGTDNVFLPSVPLRVGGTPFAQSKSNLFYFSKEVQVLDGGGQVISEELLQSLTQLGIMLVNDKSEPILFLEKVPAKRILEVLRQHNKRSVFFNTFYFALTRAASRKMMEMYVDQNTSKGIPFYSTNGFDWSAHVLEPLALSDSVAWAARNPKKGCFSSEDDWARLFTMAQEFKSQLGSPVVVNIGAEAVWFDTGMSADIVALSQLAVTHSPLRPLVRQLFGLPAYRDTVDSDVRGVLMPHKGSFLVVNSQFKRGGSIGAGSVIINSVFERRTVVPPFTVIINSRVRSFTRASAPHSLVYGYADNRRPLLLLEHAVHFSAFLLPPPNLPSAEQPALTSVTVESGVFPIKVIPKEKGKDILLRHYNAGENGDKPYLSQTILGFSEPLSFRDLMDQRRSSLRGMIEFTNSMAPQPNKAKL